MYKKVGNVVVVDDDPLDLQTISLCLKDKYKVFAFTTSLEAEKFLTKEVVPLVILDLNLNSEEDGLIVLDRWKTFFPDTEIIFCSGETNIRRAINCLRKGASDYIVKPFKKNELLEAVEKNFEKSLNKRNALFSKPMLRPFHTKFIGKSNIILEILKKAKVVAKKENINVLILGESGTGKEILARFIHEENGNPSRPFVIVNMPAIPSSLIEAELFGVEKGAYTDAKCSRPGKFEMAEGGDIFLDEIGDLSFEMQAKLLRVLQDGHVERIGSQRVRRLKFRVISATNQPLVHLMKSGRFREDLFFRLSDVIIELPPLHKRKEDIPLFVSHFITKYGCNKNITVTEKAMAELLDYKWHGNVRELESVIKRAIVFCDSDKIEKFELANNDSTFSSYEMNLAQYEKGILLDAIKKFDGNKRLARRELKLPKSTFYRKLKELEIS